MTSNPLSLFARRLARTAWHLIPLAPEKRGRLAAALRLVPAAPAPQAAPPPENAAPQVASSGAADLKGRFRRRCSSQLSDFLAGNRRIRLPTSDKPEISIVMVLFNSAELTYTTLRSLEQAIDLPTELIIIDNASSDRTAALCARIDGARIVRNADNRHFLRATNQGAAMAQGRSLLLLNNDTRLYPGALRIAHEALWAEPDIGAVGGRILLLDGSLQEAGSIIWNDGTCLGFGRGQDPEDPQFRFRREVDYCSGAFLMMRRALFEELGRLDEAFAPAYYEETDFCMRLRAKGWRILYEPGVALDHFEYGSASSSDSALALQQRNHALFLERHRETLARSHRPPTTNPLLARMRGDYRGRILVIDDRVPYPSLGAGYPRAAEMLGAMREAGWFVSFYPLLTPDVCWDDAWRLLPRDTEILAERGEARLADTLRERVGYYDMVLVSRPHNMRSFRAACAEVPEFLPATRLIYDAEAIFATRDALKKQLAGDRIGDQALDETIRQEAALAEGAALLIAVSETESELMRDRTGLPVTVIGHALEPAPTKTPFQQRADILFVGALDDDDSPNSDSLVWFVRQVMPRLDALIGPDYKLTVAGRAASQQVQALAGPRVVLLGRVEDLDPLYGSARLFIAPTRFASGLPMKVHEAAAKGLPAVVTSLLRRQLGWTQDEDVLVADEPDSFARACARLMIEPSLWQHVRDNALARIAGDCSPNNFRRSVADALSTVMKTARVNQAWGSNPDIAAESAGWYWMANPLVMRRLNRLVSDDPEANAYQRLRDLLEARGAKLPLDLVISLGCGFGGLERELVWRGIAKRIEAYDLAAGAIDAARKAAAEQGLIGVTYHLADLDKEELPAGADLVVAHQSVHHIENLESYYERVRRALKPGGLFHLHEFVGPTRFQWTDSQLRHANDFVSALPRRYRLLPSGEERPLLTRPTIADMIAADPTEAVRSSDIVGVLERYFTIIEHRRLGGALLHIGLQQIAQNFDPEVPEDREHLERFFALEDRLMEAGEIGSDFVVITALKQ